MKMSEVLSNIRKKTNAVESDKSDLTKITGYIDTGSYAINRVLTGDIHKGFPEGRISVIYGESQSGKSWVVANAVVNALQKNKYDVVYYLDSEGGGLWNFFDSKNIDRSKIQYITVASVEECKMALTTIYDTLEKAKAEYMEDPENNDEIKAMVILDSFGALAADKSVNDIIKKGQVVQDMGLTAKLKNDMMSVMMMRVVRSNAALLVVNHTYDDPAAMFASKIKHMPGGKKLTYSAHIMLQTAKKLIKSSDDDFISGVENEEEQDKGYFKGNKFVFFCTKNRCIKPGYEAHVYIDFNNGIQKWDGLVEDAVNFGYIDKKRGRYIVPSYSDKQITYKELISNDKIWETFIDKFNEESVNRMSYSTTTNLELDKIEKELDNNGKEKEDDIIG